jgi:hypothetical protein
MITESGVADYQLMPQPTGWKADYVHKHILRDILSSYDGDPLGTAPVSGQEIVRTYSVTLPATWNASKCKLVAFVHGTGSTKDVLQAEETSIED